MLSKLKEFAKHLNENTNGTLYLVGGSVRDMLVNYPSINGWAC